jgi:TorA maturation chaperone TorD
MPLGALLYYPPTAPELAGILELLKADTLADWPFGTDSELAKAVALINEGLQSSDTMSEAYQRLFVGPAHLFAPPWGSVYLDKESVMFGDSTLRLRAWLAEQGIQAEPVENEPEDHIGLMLMLTAWLITNKPETLNDYLAEHLFPWVGRYIELLTEHADNSFYKGVAMLAAISIKGWKEATGVSAKEYKLYL